MSYPQQPSPGAMQSVLLSDAPMQVPHILDPRWLQPETHPHLWAIQERGVLRCYHCHRRYESVRREGERWRHESLES